MDWDRIAEAWERYLPSARRRWRRLGAADLHAIAGQRERLAERVREIYGISRNAAQMQVEAWQGAQVEPEA